jgi:magnesium-transporting ATPase (P-type)
MSVDINAIKTTLDGNKDQYLDLTHQLNNYNEIYNVNFYLKNMNSLEYERLERANENLKAKVLKMKQEYMLLDYSRHESNMRANIMYTTLLVACIIFILCALFYQEKIQKNVMIMIITGLAVIYFAIIIFILMANSKRRKYAWDQYYWNEMKKKS